MGKRNNHLKKACTVLMILINVSFAGVIQAQADSRLESVKIGPQEWMLENLNTGHFRNGDPIPEARTAAQWEEAGKQGRPAWCYYGNNPDNGKKYGRLYNWYAVTDARGLAPAGWHIPSAEEWTNLADRYGGRRVAGPQLKSAYGWACDGNGTNESGFTGLPGGIRTAQGKFEYMGQYGYWWSSTEYNDLYAYYRYLYYQSKYLYGYVNFFKESGFSVRCIRDQAD
jgi:uncharacterized protein (TIGR02145 family)